MIEKNNIKTRNLRFVYSSCEATLADNIAKDCAKPLVGGYTGRGFIIDWVDAPVLTVDGSNPRIITGITLTSPAKCAVIDNSDQLQPFGDSNTTSNTDDGSIKFDKTLVVKVYKRGGKASKDIVEPTYKSPLGYLVCLEKKDRNGDGCYELLGVEQGVLATEITRNEYENGGATVVTLATREINFEYSFWATDYATTKAAFEAMLLQSY